MATVLHSERMSWLAVAGRYVRMRFRHPPVEHVMQKQIRPWAFRLRHRPAQRLRSAYGGSCAWTCRDRARSRGLSPRPQQRRLVSPPRSLRSHRHAHWRCRRRLSPGHVQRSIAAWPERDDKDERRAHLMLRWRGGALTDIDLDLPRSRPAIVLMVRQPSGASSATRARRSAVRRMRHGAP
jgi:hypothetical protein